MGHPATYAQTMPDKPAIIMAGSGETTSYAMLDRRSNQAAHLYRSLGLGHGDTIALCMDNRALFFELAWGAQRAGLVYVAVSSRLTASEIDYILTDSGAQVLFASDYLGPVLDELTAPVARYLAGAPRANWLPVEAALDAMPDAPVADERAGTDMLYSSGTTGKPKGVRLPIPEIEDIAENTSLTRNRRNGVRLFRKQHLSVARTALPCGPLALVHVGAPAGRHGGGDGEIRTRSGAGLHRTLWHYRQPMGSHPFCADVETARGAKAVL